MQAIVMLLAAALLFPLRARAECKEFKIVEYEDRVEAVCVGEPLSEAQKKTKQEEERRLEQEAQRQRVEDQRRQSEADRASKAQAEAEAAEALKRRNTQPSIPQPQLNMPTTTNPQIIYK
jgi:hypothetical protein